MTKPPSPIILCPCPCHQGKEGFFHCFSVCCDEPDVISDPPPLMRIPLKVGPFMKITLPMIKEVFPGSIADAIEAAPSSKDEK